MTKELGGRRQVKVPLSSVKGQGFTVVKERPSWSQAFAEEGVRSPNYKDRANRASRLLDIPVRSWVAEVKARLCRLLTACRHEVSKVRILGQWMLFRLDRGSCSC